MPDDALETVDGRGSEAKRRVDPWSERRVAILSIAGVWSLLFVLRVLQIIVAGQVRVLPASEQAAFVFSCGAVLSWPFYLILRRSHGASIRTRLAIVGALAFALAGVLAPVSFCIWFRVVPWHILLPRPPHAVTLRLHVARSFTGLFLMFVGWASIYASVISALESREAERRAAKIAIEKRDAELTALRCQLNPHFLFNALNSISALALRGDGSAAEDAIEMLSSYLRTALTENGDGDVSLEEELERERLYLAIEKVRFGHRLQVRWHVPPELGAVRMPALLLQPVVENVVRHAVSMTDRCVTMDVTAFAVEDRLHLVVEDDGPGRSDCAGHGIGLENVRSRLATRYEGLGRLSVGPGARGGYRTELVVPLGNGDR